MWYVVHSVADGQVFDELIGPFETRKAAEEWIENCKDRSLYMRAVQAHPPYDE